MDIDCLIVNASAIRHTLIALLSGKKIIGYLNDYSFKFNYINNYRMEFVGFDNKSYWVEYSQLHLTERGNPALEYLDLEKIKRQTISNTFQPNDSDYVVIHAGADFPGRQWPVENYIKLIKFIEMRYPDNIKRIFLTGGPKT